MTHRVGKHYGFTEEELDFIINYDIKYRMGDELNAGEWKLFADWKVASPFRAVIACGVGYWQCPAM